MAYITVLVADDHPVVRKGLVTEINDQSDMHVVAEAQNGEEAVEMFLTHHPDVCLLDLRMPVMDGLQTVISIREKEPNACLVIVTSYETREDIYRAMQAGARGYFLKESPVREVLECIRTVAAGSSWIPPAVGAKLATRLGDLELTPRELDVLHSITKGKSNKEIGAEFNIAESTVKVHVSHILEKLKVTGRTEAINVAVQRGLVRIETKKA
ncbi:MAG TPA: response regulator transcription factor [Candidatus Solibacter sp.]|jgi:two-component system NarL family response regulator|nr:response regulator transcription factor [Candidatus Solibacter sp.]